ncbi:MAG: Trk system potassium transporter TrkA [Clostridiales bacterium]|nr:Trk system potassium transporter TrkA [Clostridiales bacterium]
MFGIKSPVKRSPVKKGLKIIIVGCGKVGETLVEQLVREGHDITIIDQDSERVQEIAELYDVMGLVGNGASHSVQMDAGIETTDLIIAVTESDELNLLCCTIAKQVGNCSAIARVRTPDYSREIGYLREKLGLAMIINPEMESASEAARLLFLPSALEAHSFARGQVELLKFSIPEESALNGITVAEMGRNSMSKVLVCAVERDGRVYIPNGDFRILQGDVLFIVASRMMMKPFLRQMGFATAQVSNTLIIGGGKATYYLAKQLTDVGIDVKIIEKDKSRCEELSILLPKATIINGDGTDQDLLEEEGISYAESVVALTGIDEENILLTLYVRHVSNAKVITKINRITFKDVINRLDLGSVIYPRYLTSEAIIAYVRGKKNSMDSNVESIHHMFDSKAEAIEFRVKEESEMTNVPLKDLSLKKDLLVACIHRKGTVIIPSGMDSIQVGDTVLVVTTHIGFDDLHDILF